MSLHTFAVMLAMGQPPAGTQQDPRANMVSTFGMLAVMAVMFYLLLIRPQQKKAKEQATLMAKLKAGDKIVTSSGIVAVVVTVKDKTVTVRSADTKLEILKGTVTEISEAATES